ncbi:MAG: type II toxin-antitoxin system prevent-host-death family antitoxin [Bdellovibrionales bacterium]|nr:type II toxin-antitoxin system prevent-host-death family antitoxin [Ramlibacter sp.]
MRKITYSEARKRLSAAMHSVTAEDGPMIITRPSGEAVVMMSIKDYRSWEETAYLLSSPANARSLAKSLEEANAGKLLAPDLNAFRLT